MKPTDFFADMSIRVRVLITSLLLTLGLTLLTGALAVKEYRSDKLAYLHELHAARTAVVAARLRETLIGLKMTQGSEVWSGQLPRDLLRQPYENEIFVSPTLDHLNVLSAASVQELRVQKLSYKDIERTLDLVAGTPLLILSQSGSIVFSQNHSLTKSDLDSLVEGVFKSQMTEGQTVYRLAREETALGFREVPDTNLVVATFSPLNALLQPLREGTREWLVMVIPILLLGLSLQSWILRRLNKPIGQMIGFFEMLVRGRWDTQVAIPQGEFAPVFAGAVALQHAVAEREARLKLFAEGLKRTIEFSHQLDVVRDFRRATETLRKMLSPVILPHNQFSPRFFDATRGVMWILKNNHSWESEPVGQNLLADALSDPQLAQGGICTTTFNNESFGELLIPVFDDKTLLGAILIPLEPSPRLAEVSNLAPVICKTLSEMILRCNSEDNAAREARLGHELSLARQMLERSLVLENEDISNLWIDSLFEPAESVGGDWMGVFPHIEAGIVNMYVGDVTGHGIDSAFHASLVAGAIKAAETDLAESFRKSATLHSDRGEQFDGCEYLARSWVRLNDVFLDATQEKMMTMLFLSLNLHTGELIFLGAGHPPPLYIPAHPEDSIHRPTFLAKPAPPLGSIQINPTLAPGTLKLKTGDLVLAVTDGFDENIKTPSGHISKRIIMKAATEHLRSWKKKDESPLKELYTWSITAGSSYSKVDDVSLLAFRYLGH